MVLILVLLGILSPCMWGMATASGIISVYLQNYSNPSSRDYLGFCCDAGPWCISHCDNYFTVCAQPLAGEKCVRVQKTGIFRDDSLIFPKDLKNGRTNPLLFPFEGQYNGTVSLKVEVWDEDVADVDDLVGMFSGNVSIPAANPSASQNGTEVSRFSYGRQLNTIIKVHCSEDYYGDRCQTYCRLTNGESESYRCNPWTGKKECVPGKTGVNCDLNACRPGCSLEHGTCESKNECLCKPGWHGYNCTECLASEKCQNGYCQEGSDCTCYPGWEGEFCDQGRHAEKGRCRSSPCQNGGKCYDLGKEHYKCSCSLGFTGKHCESELDPCYYHRKFNGEGRTPSDFIDPRGPFRNDRSLKEGWYRIIGAKRGVLFNRCGALYTCGTKYPVHIQETVAKNATGIVTAHACASSCLGCCHLKMEIQVKLCQLHTDQFFVYKLRPSLSNEMGYCVE